MVQFFFFDLFLKWSKQTSSRIPSCCPPRVCANAVATWPMDESSPVGRAGKGWLSQMDMDKWWNMDIPSKMRSGKLSAIIFNSPFKCPWNRNRQNHYHHVEATGTSWGFVAQDTQLFTCSIEENLAYGLGREHTKEKSIPCHLFDLLVVVYSNRTCRNHMELLGTTIKYSIKMYKVT